MRQSSQAQVENVRIESWKQIASFFDRDERTVKRWERERALPVHRLPGERGGVFAYTLELDQWLNTKAHQKSVSAPLAIVEATRRRTSTLLRPLVRPPQPQ